MVVIMSLWRNDEHRNIEARMAHLRAKTCHLPTRWLWVVGDSDDATEVILRGFAMFDRHITVIRHDTGIVGDSAQLRRRRAGATASAMFAEIFETDQFACLHESDLRSAAAVVDQLIGPNPTAGWPVIAIDGEEKFYDTWAFRDITNTYFDAHVTPPARRFEVASFGSVWAAPASLVRNRVLRHDNAIVDLCQQWREEGEHLFVDPFVRVEQPVELWTPC